MPDRAAIVTGGTRGIGRAVADALAEEGYALTITGRKPDSVERAVAEIRAAGADVHGVAANLTREEAVSEIVGRHRDAYGRLDVLVNNAGVGFGAAATEHQTKYVDMQWQINVRAIILFYREATPLLRAAAAEHRNALVVNLSSMAGKIGTPWLSVYSATKSAVIAYTEAMNGELGPEGIKSVALCPGYVDTDMSEFVKDQLPADQMIQPQDLGETVRFLLRLTPGAVVPELMIHRPGDPRLVPQA